MSITEEESKKMKVQGIFKTLVIVVCCVVLGAMVLNIFLPNVVTQLSNVVEDSIYKGTGMSFDFNGDGHGGGANVDNSYLDTDNGGAYDEELNDKVEGFN